MGGNAMASSNPPPPEQANRPAGRTGRAAAESPDIAERYEREAVLGQGGFAPVYRARDRTLGRMVALKLLFPHLAADATVRGRFLAEARALARLHHPNIV